MASDLRLTAYTRIGLHVDTDTVIRLLTKPREDVSKTTVQWSNTIVEIAVVGEQATPLLRLLIELEVQRIIESRIVQNC